MPLAPPLWTGLIARWSDTMTNVGTRALATGLGSGAARGVGQNPAVDGFTAHPGISIGPRRHLRLFLSVFLIVFLGGLGTSGAAALWSQSATVETTVQTGTWGVDRTRPGWPMPLNFQVNQTASGTKNRTLIVSWSPQKTEDVQLNARYEWAHEGPPRHHNYVLLVRSSTSREFRVSQQTGGSAPPQFANHEFRVTVTPSVNGVNAKPTSIVITLNGSQEYRWRYD